MRNLLSIEKEFVEIPIWFHGKMQPQFPAILKHGHDNGQFALQ